MSFIVVPRRRENFSFPSFPSSTSFPYLVLDARSRRSIRISLQGSPSSFIQSNPSNGWTERRSRDFFFFFFFVIDTVLLVKIRCAYSNERGILRQDINLDRKDTRTIDDPMIFLLDRISSTFFLDAVPRGRFLPASWRDHSPVSLYCVCFNFFSYMWKTD